MIVSGRLPCVRVGTSFDPMDDAPLSSDSILAMLVAAGGSRYVENLGPAAKQWQLGRQGLGVINVSAFQRGQHRRRRASRSTVPPLAVAPASSRRGASRRPAAPKAKSGRPEARPSRPVKASVRPPQKRAPSEAPRSNRPKAVDRLSPGSTAPAIPRAPALGESAQHGQGQAVRDADPAGARARAPRLGAGLWKPEAETSPDVDAQAP